MAASTEVEVVKIGGSLLARDDFVPAMKRRISKLRNDHPARHHVFVVGGGDLVEVLRKIDAQSPLPSDTAHWLAIDLMEVAGGVVASWLGEIPSTSEWTELERLVSVPGGTLFLAADFLRSHEPQLPGDKLPVDWRATSDSIAARLCTCLGATKLRLLKSRRPTEGELANLAAAARSELVDECMTALAKSLDVEFDTLGDRNGP